MDAVLHLDPPFVGSALRMSQLKVVQKTLKLQVLRDKLLVDAIFAVHLDCPNYIMHIILYMSG